MSTATTKSSKKSEVTAVTSTAPVVVKEKKSKKTEEKKEQVPAPVETPVVVKEKKEKKVRVSKETSSDLVSSAPTPAPSPTTVPSTSEEVVQSESSVSRTPSEQVSDLLSKMESSVNSELEQLRKTDPKSSSVKVLKSLSRDVKSVKSLVSKMTRKKSRVPRAEGDSVKKSGFNKPIVVSSELAKFLGLKEGEMVSRVNVTKSLWSYVKEHKLNLEKDKRKFVPDQALGKLLNCHDQTDIFVLQRLIKGHFPKAESVSSSA